MPYKRYKDKKKRRDYLRNYMRGYRQGKATILIDKQVLKELKAKFPNLIPSKGRKQK